MKTINIVLVVMTLLGGGSVLDACLPAKYKQIVTNSWAQSGADEPKFAGGFICLQNQNFTGGILSHSPCLDLVGMTVDESYSYLFPAYRATGLTHVNDPDAPAVRFAGTMSTGTRIWWVNFNNAALRRGVEQDHPLECQILSEKVYSCQWIPTATPKEWSNYQQMRFQNVTDFPSFFNVLRSSIENHVFISKLARMHKEAAIAGEAAASKAADWYYVRRGGPSNECQKLSSTPRQWADAAVKRGVTDLEITSNDGDGADVVIKYSLNGEFHWYSFFESSEKCANPFEDADRSRSDFGQIDREGVTEEGKANQILADEALKHSTDKGPWWVADGTKIYPGCKPSKLTPMEDARAAKSKGARDVEILGGIVTSDKIRPTDVVVKYKLNGNSFYNDYYTNKFCDAGSQLPESEKRKAIEISSHNPGVWYADYFSDNMKCLVTKGTPADLAEEVRKQHASDIEFSLPSTDDGRPFLFLQYGFENRGHQIAFYRTHDACSDDISN